MVSAFGMGDDELVFRYVDLGSVERICLDSDATILDSKYLLSRRIDCASLLDTRGSAGAHEQNQRTGGSARNRHDHRARSRIPTLPGGIEHDTHRRARSSMSSHESEQSIFCRRRRNSGGFNRADISSGLSPGIASGQSFFEFIPLGLAAISPTMVILVTAMLPDRTRTAASIGDRCGSIYRTSAARIAVHVSLVPAPEVDEDGRTLPTSFQSF